MKVKLLTIWTWWSPLLPWSSIWKWGVHHYVSGVCQSAIARSSECTFVTVQRSSIWKCWLSKSYSKIINKKVKRVFLWNQGDHQYESAAEFGGARYGFVRKAWLSGIWALIAFNVMFPEMSEIGFNCNICWWIFQILGTTWLWMSMALALNVNLNHYLFQSSLIRSKLVGYHSQIQSHWWSQSSRHLQFL